MELREQPSKTDAVMDCGESVVLLSLNKEEERRGRLRRFA